MSNERVAKLIFYSEFQGIKLKKKAKKYVVIEYLLDKCIKNDLYRALFIHFSNENSDRIFRVL